MPAGTLRQTLLVGLCALTALAGHARPAKTPAKEPAPLSATTNALLGVAVAAADESRYCEALWLFEALHLRNPSPRALYNAAEVAAAAGDRVKALDLYRTTQQRYPTFDKASLVQARSRQVFQDMTKQGPGTACPAREDICGDWMLRPTDGGEQCDDGNRTDGDGCDGNCTITACGNGVVTGLEECDDGNRTDGDGCDNNCTASRCGNGVVAGGEVCDDGNPIEGDGCDHTCTPTRCGNGVVTAGEQCDDGNSIDGDGCDAGCTMSRCGNGIVTGFEQCDDGNDVVGDGCETDCTLTRVRRPLPGLAVAILGAVSAVGGGALIAGGSQNYSAAEEARQDLVDAENAFVGDPAGSVTAIDALRQTIAARDENARNVGAPLVAGGIGLIAAGTVGLGVGVWLAVTNTELAGGPL